MNWQLSQHAYFPFFDNFPDREIDTDPELLVTLLKDSVHKRLISDRPVRLLLSGGIDSTLILSTLVSLGLQDQCLIYMGDTGRSEGYRYAKQCVDKLGIQAETVVLDYDHNTFDRFLQIIRHQEKPVSLNGSSMGMPQMYEVISSHGVPVVLDGTGGDELFGGYWQRKFPYAVRDAVKQGDWKWLRRQLQCKAGKNEVKSHLLTSLMPASAIEGVRCWEEETEGLGQPVLQGGRPIDIQDIAHRSDVAADAELHPGHVYRHCPWRPPRRVALAQRPQFDDVQRGGKKPAAGLPPEFVRLYQLPEEVPVLLEQARTAQRVRRADAVANPMATAEAGVPLGQKAFPAQ